MSHDHHHEVSNYNQAFAIGVFLNMLFVVIEFVYGISADSLALIADAGHNLSDVLSLLLAWGASVIAMKPNSDKRTYGFRKATIMASLVSAVVLLVALGSISWEAWQRFSDPQPIEGMTMVIVAAIGVVINTITALLFLKGQKDDLNIKGAFLHMSADAAVSLGVVVTGLLILWGGWLWLDPAISLVIVFVVFISTWGLLRDSFNYSLDAVPTSADLNGIRNYLLGLETVISLHDLHVWPLSTTLTALTVHLVVNNEGIDNELLASIQSHLHDKFNIEHATIQVESSLYESQCMLT